MSRFFRGAAMLTGTDQDRRPAESTGVERIVCAVEADHHLQAWCERVGYPVAESQQVGRGYCYRQGAAHQTASGEIATGPPGGREPPGFRCGRCIYRRGTAWCGRKERRVVTADLLSRARSGDGEAFRELAESRRRELQVHR